jgi:tetratricopeptide (TPR) repeat protein
MTYREYRAATHPVPYVLRAEHRGASLVYFGAAHSWDPAAAPAGQLEAMWAAFRPDFALNEGGDPPVEVTRELAIGRHAEAGLVRFLGARDSVPVASLDPSMEQEAAHLRASFSAEQLVTFYVLRWAMQDVQRPAPYQAISIEERAEQWLWSLSAIPALEGGPRTLAAFESACRRLAPSLADWRAVPPSWFDPATGAPEVFTNEIARAASEYRDRYMLGVIERALASHRRVLAVVGASHVVMQELALRSTLGSVHRETLEEVDTPAPEAVSLLGRPLVAPPIAPDRREQLERDLARYAERAASSNPNEGDFIWLGRTLAYLHRYRDAVAAYTRGLARFPDSHRLLRHRGHRYLTLRDFHAALEDLRRADAIVRERGIPDEVEPDGVPNRLNIPRSTTNTNILYHLGLAHYFLGDNRAAADAFRRCLDQAPNDDMVVASVNWLYLSLRRAGDAEGATAVLARVKPNMEVFENETYHRLCLVYRGEVAPEGASPHDPNDRVGALTAGYALAALGVLEGRVGTSREQLREVAESDIWPAFAAIAAEADLARGGP